MLNRVDNFMEIPRTNAALANNTQFILDQSAYN